MARRSGVISKRWVAACATFLFILYHYRRSSSLADLIHRGLRAHSDSNLSRSHDRGDPPFKDTFVNELDPVVYSPYPAYNSPEWLKKWKGPHIPCSGPRGVYVNNDPNDMILAHKRPVEEVTQEPLLGSYRETGLDPVVCFDARARYRPYGYDQEDIKSAGTPGVKWDDVDWAKLQKSCAIRNKNRYMSLEHVNETTTFKYPTQAEIERIDDYLHFPEDEERQKKTSSRRKAKHEKRSAIVFEIPASKEWTIDTIQYLRAIIMETNLHSGGEFELLLMIGVRDDEGPILNNEGVHRSVMEKSVPLEFQDLAVLFNQRLLKAWYPRVYQTDHSTNPLSTPFQPLQLLSLARPDLEYFWLMDIDARYTGHHYELLYTMAMWAQSQPRDHSWEQASVVYVPEVHNSWDNFTDTIRKLGRSKKPVKGPLEALGIEPIGPEVPRSKIGGKKHGWGIGEEADFITAGPIFEPVPSASTDEWFIENYPGDVDDVPRRAVAFPHWTRTSKRLLRAMHHGQITRGTNMPSTMYPVSTALHHGLKIASFPLPVYSDSQIPSRDIERALNLNEGRDTFDHSSRYRDQWRRLTFAVAIDNGSTYADELYKRWLGYDKEETEGLCLPGILLHPIKGV